jgi:hypothetical protein
MAQNHKDLKVKKLIERGVTDPKTIARKLGYTGNATQAGIERVHHACKNLGISLGNTHNDQKTSRAVLALDDPGVAT